MATQIQEMPVQGAVSSPAVMVFYAKICGWVMGHECDDGNENPSDGCDGQCIQCLGNGRLETGEVCDDGNRDNTDACTNGCEAARCGDGVTRAGEEACDDGNEVETDACTSACEIARCGDGQIWAGVEVCDDGNRNNTDECTNSCEAARCGDGIAQASGSLR